MRTIWLVQFLQFIHEALGTIHQLGEHEKNNHLTLHINVMLNRMGIFLLKRQLKARGCSNLPKKRKENLKFEICKKCKTALSDSFWE